MDKSEDDKLVALIKDNDYVVVSKGGDVIYSGGDRRLATGIFGFATQAIAEYIEVPFDEIRVYTGENARAHYGKDNATSAHMERGPLFVLFGMSAEEWSRENSEARGNGH